MKRKILIPIIFIFACSLKLVAQQRAFSQWNATAFCSYTRYHPYEYIKADNNWEIIYALRNPHTRKYLDSLSIKNTDSQMMLLRIEGFIEQKDNGNWVSSIPVLDSLQTIEARAFSTQIATDLYPQIKSDCIELVDILKQENYKENAFSILFSYVLDGEIWKSFNSYSNLKSAATWDGDCWAFYFPRKFRCGTNSYGEFHVCWSEIEPAFMMDELNSRTFIKPFMQEYKSNGKIISQDIRAKALALGIIDEDGSLKIPIISSKDSNSQLDILSKRIIDPIIQFFANSDVVHVFQQKFHVHRDKKKLACTMLYHEVMWDLVDLLIDDKIIELPILWQNMDKRSTYSVVFIKN